MQPDDVSIETGKTMKRKRERGQSLVELGISLLILLYLLSGAVELGVLLFQFVQLRDAAQEGALYGSMNPTETSWVNIEARARAASASPINLNDPAQVKVQIYMLSKAAPPEDLGTLVWENGVQQTTTTLDCEGNGVRVTVSFRHIIFMPFMPQLLGRSYTDLSATVVDTILTPVCGP
jgi:Flp pilus assembly protein TadG